MMLGPFKSPGPDGFSAKVMQDNWSYFGPVITKEVGEFFATGHMKPNIARSNLVLIPKIQEPAKVTDYRPISVCNLIYKVISKLLAARIKPFMPQLISPSQSVFVPGREIAENVILLREILHSF